jgi:hypothetical protein
LAVCASFSASLTATRRSTDSTYGGSHHDLETRDIASGYRKRHPRSLVIAVLNRDAITRPGHDARGNARA